MNERRRGACPSVREPLRTGDGWLARWTPHWSIPIEVFVRLCDVAEQRGNGVLEVTHRGSLQIRGLSSGDSLEGAFSQAGAPVQELPVLLSSPLLGLDSRGSGFPAEVLRTLGSHLAQRKPAGSLHSKVSLLLDYDGPLHLEALSADIRLHCGQSMVHLSLAGTAETATPFGWMRLESLTAVLETVLTALEQQGAGCRVRDLLSGTALAALQRALAYPVSSAERPPPRSPASPFTNHTLADGTIARGFALAFGYSPADRLRTLAHTAKHLGARAFRLAPDRVIMVVGLPERATQQFLEAAADAGMITDIADARRYVVACPGKPICASAHLQTRGLAPEVARAAGPLLGPSNTIHLSGCPKGCAHPQSAPLTFAGPDSVILGGRADSVPTCHMDSNELIATLERLNEGRESRHEPPASENAFADLARPLHVSMGN